MEAKEDNKKLQLLEAKLKKKYIEDMVKVNQKWG